MTAKKKPAAQALTVHLVDSEDGPRADSREIAAYMGVDHHATMQLIRRYAAEMESAGSVAFQMQPSKAKGGGGAGRTFALLNEEQAIFLLTLSRNTPRTVELKRELSGAFIKARRRASITAPSTDGLWRQAMAAEMREAESAAMASAASYILLERKVVKHLNHEQVLVLRNQMQMVFPLFSEEELKAVQRVRRSNAKKLMNGGSNA